MIIKVEYFYIKNADEKTSSGLRRIRFMRKKDMDSARRFGQMQGLRMQIKMSDPVRLVVLSSSLRYLQNSIDSEGELHLLIRWKKLSRKYTCVMCSLDIWNHSRPFISLLSVLVSIG